MLRESGKDARRNMEERKWQKRLTVFRRNDRNFDLGPNISFAPEQIKPATKCEEEKLWKMLLQGTLAFLI
jgi:hypothetical protein